MAELLLDNIHTVPAIAPVDTTSSAVTTDYIGLKEYSTIKFVIPFGVITGDTATVTVVESDDNAGTTTTAIAFKYRKSSAVGTDSNGDLTAATTSGVTIAATDDNKVLQIFVNSADLSEGYPYVAAVVTPGGSMSACLVSATAELKPRYAQASMVSAVD